MWFDMRTSATAGDLLWEGKMRLVGAAQGLAGALLHLPRGEQAVGRDGAPLAVDPLGRERVEPGALDGQLAGDDAHARARPLDAAVVVAQPGAHLLTAVPAGVVP